MITTGTNSVLIQRYVLYMMVVEADTLLWVSLVFCSINSINEPLPPTLRLEGGRLLGKMLKQESCSALLQ
jgi:hypothetical protein